ncbi:branched-chain amino acid ABC transporter ATP-binding protein [Salinisphaera orenii MK-B5]|uniref:Branched-chain amino acid ABC transporter ATP-binding protein n=1 Tax=Salinisphaera orenii MK-B5 TaxID=856730 RepID=A0A423PGH7_9GAMM|nr:ATP-binding cassette domain-containing protein [Salinisphaera orenii]ROO24697.1 branched-chain amino acid ABC transporter ATP-binding protein [Salinisphaera orenii MK-B5]
MSALLQTQGLGKTFRGLAANADIDFAIEPRSIHCVIGPNGAGKTTFLSMISGHLAPSSGRIFYNNADITRLATVARARSGIARKFQTPSVFHGLTTRTNIELAALRGSGSRGERRARIDEVLETIGLSAQAQRLAAHLSHGQRQWLEIGMLLAMQAKVLLLDEPAAGMTAGETAATGALLQKLVAERGLAIIVIEHNMDFIRDLDAEITVLHLGRVIANGRFDEIAADPRVADVYLGQQA